MSDSVQPHRWQPTRLPCPWDSLGKNTGVGCHFLLQCMKVESESEVAQSCLTLSNPIDCSLPGSSNHVIFQARVLEWGAIAFSKPVSRKAYISWRSRILFCFVSFLSNSFLKGNFSVLYTIVIRNHGLSLQLEHYITLSEFWKSHTFIILQKK